MLLSKLLLERPYCLFSLYFFVLLSFFSTNSQVFGQRQFIGLKPEPRGFNDSVQIDLANSEAIGQLTRAKAFIEANQIVEAMERLDSAIKEHGQKLIELPKRPQSFQRYLSVEKYVQILLCQQSEDFIERYREQFDPRAREIYEAAMENRDVAQLEKIVDRYFMSSWTDDALYVLAEMALQRADYRAARNFYELMLPLRVRYPSSTDLFLLSYPDTDFEYADIFARMILISILEGDLFRANHELTTSMFGEKSFQDRFPDSKGILAGKEQNYLQYLQQLSSEAKDWPAFGSIDEWNTFGGSATRTKQQNTSFRYLGKKPWTFKLEASKVRFDSIKEQVDPRFQIELNDELGNFFKHPRIGENPKFPLVYHPIVYQDWVIVNQIKEDEESHQFYDEILVINLHDGKPAWQNNGVIYRSTTGRPFYAGGSSPGTPRFTLTVHDDRLYARVGSPLTTDLSNPRMTGVKHSSLVCLDLRAGGKQKWNVKTEEKWSFEGSPVVDGSRVYIAMKQSVSTPILYVVCLDAVSGKRIWRSQIAATTGIERGSESTISHTLLTLDHDRIYCSSNMGVVASLDAKDGSIEWLTEYPRAKLNTSETSGYVFRDLTPAIYHRGMVFIAPNDTKDVMALDANNGTPLWANHSLQDATQLLGAVGNTLLVSGKHLAWLDIHTGKFQRDAYPDSNSAQGYGRGMIVGDHVYWPTKNNIQILPVNPNAKSPSGQLLKSVIQLSHPPIWETSGNIIVCKNTLIIAQPDKIIGFSPKHQATPMPKPNSAHIQTNQKLFEGEFLKEFTPSTQFVRKTGNE